MPDTSLSDAIKEAYALAPTDTIIHHTIEFRHAAFTAPIRCVLGFEDLVATLEADAPLNPGAAVTFTAFAFELGLPSVEEGATPEISIAIDNVSREITDQLDLAAESTSLIEVTYRPYLSTDLTQPQMDPPLHLVVTEIDADLLRVTARGSYGDFRNKRFPAEDYTAVRFPGLVR